MTGRRWTAVIFGLALVLALIAVRLADPYPARLLREAQFDLYQQVKPRELQTDLPIRVVAIDELSLSAQGQWPWPREVMARLTDRLARLGAAVIVFDVLFSEPGRNRTSGRDGDAEFAAAIASAPVVLSMASSGQGLATPPSPKAGHAATGENTTAALPMLDGLAQPISSLAGPAAGMGVVSLGRGEAGVVRSLPLAWRAGESVFPALSVEALRVALAAQTLVLLGDSAGAGTVEALRIGNITVPTGPSGDLALYYRHLPENIYLSAQELLSADEASVAPLVARHIVLIGSTAAGLLDVRSSALGEPVPGIAIHVQAIEQMLTGTYLTRTQWVGGLEFLLTAAAGLTVVLAVVFFGPVQGLVLSLAAATAIAFSSWGAFAGLGVLLDASYPLFAALLVYAAMTFFRFAVTDADRRRIRRAFSHYVEPSLLRQIEADSSLLRLGGDVRTISVMFCDVRNFSALSERTQPADLVVLLNRLFAALGEEIVANLGTIDKFMGDAVMAFWNAPVSIDRYASRACRAALAMRDALAALNTEIDEPVAIGIGIATGSALVGNMGFERRFDYSCVGDTVNVASRIEAASRGIGYSLLVSHATALAASDMAMLPAGSIQLRGMSKREHVHILVGGREMLSSAAFFPLRDSHERLVDQLRLGILDQQLLDECILLGSKLQPELANFYTAISGRLEDFAPSI